MVFWFTFYTCAVFSMLSTVANNDNGKERNIIIASNKIPSSQRLLLVSTLDGLITAFSVENELKQVWQIDLGCDLFASSLRSFQVMHSGKLLIIIPSLQGGLFAVHNSYIETLPFSSDTLLSSGFRLTDDVYVVGSIEIKTYTVSVSNGIILQHSSKNGSISSQEMANNPDQKSGVVIFRVTTRTVRAVSITGKEEWYYVVSNVETFSTIPRLEKDFFNASRVIREDLSFSIPDGTVYFVNESKNTIHARLNSPISKVWEYVDGNVLEINLFDIHHLHMESEKFFTQHNKDISPLVYMGEYHDQYYVQVSDEVLEELLEVSQENYANPKRLSAKNIRSNLSSRSHILPLNNQLIFFAKHNQLSIPRLPNDEINAVSLPGLCNKGGFFLLDDEKRPIANRIQRKSPFSFSVFSTTWCALFTMFFFFRKDRRLLRAFSNYLSHLYTPTRLAAIKMAPEIDNDETNFISRYETEYTHVKCLGKGGFGVVFEARNFLDFRRLAIKRIKLSDGVDDKVMTEIRYLAQIQHQHVVQYYCAWIECPPRGWQREKDKFLMGDVDLSEDEEYDDETVSNSEETRSSRKHTALVNSKSCSIIFDVISPLSESRRKKEDVPQRTNNSDVSINIEFLREDPTTESEDHHSVRFDLDDSEDSVTHSSACAQRLKSSQLTGELNVLRFRDEQYSTSSENVTDESHQRAEDSNISEEIVRTHQETARHEERDHGRNTVEHETYLYFAMELCQQQTLKEWLIENTTDRSYDDALWYFYQICQGLNYMHEKNFVHRDLKPSNIFFSVDDGLVKIGDFGLVTHLRDVKNGVRGSKSAKSNLVLENAGTELYMSPEQLAFKSYNEKIDIYALGIILFELVHPFDTQMERVNTLKCLPHYVNSEPSSLSKEITALAEFQHKYNLEFRLISWLLSSDPAKRPSCKDLLVSLLFNDILTKYVNPNRLSHIGLKSPM